ncbi:hypothetical protein I8748_32485 [Nostoc sp. CENA67]|uniref:Uncharacterized protein n=1 Tax=Amazonocrinis nigriterrae CENA67 TaxID=2794033 RepID=A0A8J7LBJ9_9NOST|nr:hypothetical protein [Amazonocrinis nigriterrae]MBH8566813.1 hypothetical protein [Amazonocrinis nigriterrae CENA67]
MSHWAVGRATRSSQALFFLKQAIAQHMLKERLQQAAVKLGKSVRTVQRLIDK